MPKQIHGEEEIYTHEYLWRSATLLLRQAEAHESGSYYYLLSSLLMSYLAFEAFVNFAGYVVLPELWGDERQQFRGKGLEGKLERILTKLPGFVWHKDKRPYRTIKNLQGFRDTVSHGKVLAKQYVREFKEDGSHYSFEHTWDSFISSPASVQEAQSEIKSFCNNLLVELRKYSDHQHLNFNAFEGSLASGSGSTMLTLSDSE